jgi:hypothetical protein
VRFRLKIIFLTRKNVLAYYSAGVAVVHSKVVGLAPGIFGMEVGPKLEDKTCPKILRPKWSFIRSIPAPLRARAAARRRSGRGTT